MTPDQLLYTRLDGQPSTLEDVIADALDHDYSTRLPLLRQLLDTGSPREQLHTCAILAAWGVRDGLLRLIDWARAPEAVPWAGAPVELDRFSGVDAAFALLTNALRWAQPRPLTPVASRLRRLAVYDLLLLYPRFYFDRSIFVLLNLDPDTARAEQQTITWAIDQALAATQSSPPRFDLPTQIAFLLMPLAALDDAQAAARAETLLAYFPERHRTLRELAYAMGAGTGPATCNILERLARPTSSPVRQEAAEWLSRREATSQ